MLDAIKLLQQNGSTIEATFETDSGSKKVVVQLDLLLCADGALSDSDIGFCCEECCVIRTCSKKKFGDLEHKIWPLKTEEYVNNSAHMPYDGNYNFSCPHDACKFACRSKAGWQKEEKRLKNLTANASKTFKSNHKGMSYSW